MRKEHFLIDPEVIFLNHGSFGATPKAIFKEYQAWQYELEKQPVQFLGGKITPLLNNARVRISEYLGASADNLVFIPNATFGVNVIAKSLKLSPKDEILTTNHEYGACVNAWKVCCQSSGARFLQQEIPIPIFSAEDIVDQFWQGVSENTKIIYLSHISSPTAIRFPIEEICRRAREAGILTVIDGAHSPDQIHLNLNEIDADFYTGNFHKWALSPKGAGFLYARQEVQHLVEPLVVGWGWSKHPDFSTGSNFIDNLQWLGTNDLSAYLAVPAAIQFQVEHNWPVVREKCHHMLAEVLQRINHLTGLSSIYSNEDEFFIQMGAAELPLIEDLTQMQKHLYETFRIEVPLIEWHGRHFIRVSVQGYNSQEDLDALITALEKLLPLYT